MLGETLGPPSSRNVTPEVTHGHPPDVPSSHNKL